MASVKAAPWKAQPGERGHRGRVASIPLRLCVIDEPSPSRVVVKGGQRPAPGRGGRNSDPCVVSLPHATVRPAVNCGLTWSRNLNLDASSKRHTSSQPFYFFAFFSGGFCSIRMLQ